MTDRFRMLPSYHYENNTDGTLLKSVGKPLRDYKIEGNSVQDGVPSPDNPIEIESVGEKTANLFDINIIDKMINGYGENYTAYMKNENGILTNNMADYGLYTGYVVSMKLGKGLYCLSLDARFLKEPGGISITFNFDYTIRQYFSSTLFGLDWNRVFYIFEIVEDTEITSWNFVPSGNASNYLSRQVQFTNIMLSQISNENEHPEYEPYGKYKIPITVGGKNLCNPDEIITNGRKENGFIYGTNIDIYLKAGTYTLTFKYGGGIGDHIFFRKGQVASGYIQGSSTVDKTSGKITFTFEEDEYLRITHFGSKETTYFYDFMLTEGTLEAMYKPYHEPKTYNIYLDRPLRKVDYIDFKNGKVVRNVYCGKFNDVCRYGWGSQYATGLCRVQGNLVPAPKYDVCPLSNALECYTTLKAIKNTLSIVNSAKNIYAYFHIDDVGLEPVTQTTSSREIGDKIRSYIENNNIDIAYVLETPTEEPIDLPEILTHKGTNIISIGTEIQPSAINYQYYKGGN